MKRSKVLLSVLVLALLCSVPVFGTEWSEPQLWQHAASGNMRMPWLTPDNVLYFVYNYNIYQSKWTGSEWTVPEAVPGPVNTGQNEISPVVVKNGTVLYFGRYNEGTNYDFYRSEWDEAKQAWGRPEPVVAWNTPDQEWGLWVSEEDDLAYFGSRGTYNGVAPLGGRDLWMSERTSSGEWSTPVNLGKPINTENNEWTPFVDAAGNIYFDSDREGGEGEYSIWVAKAAKTKPEVFAITDSSGSEREIAMNDNFLVFSATNRPGNIDAYDLWISVNEGKAEVAKAAQEKKPAPAGTFAALGSGLTVDYFLEGNITISLDEGDNYGSVNYKPMMFGAIIAKGEPVKGLDTYLRIRHRNYLSGTTDEGNVIWVDKYMVTADILGVDSRVFWNDGIKSFKTPINIVDGNTVKANAETADGAINGLDFTAKDFYGFDFYGVYLPQYRRLTRNQPVLAGRAFRDLLGYEVSYNIADLYDLTLSRSEVNIVRSHKDSAFKHQWGVWGIEASPVEDLRVGAHWAQVKNSDPSKGMVDTAAGNAYYLKGSYTFGDGTYSIAYKKADDKLAYPVWENPLGKVSEKFPADSQGIELGASYKVAEGVTVGYEGDFIKIAKDSTTQTKNAFTIEAKEADYVASAKLQHNTLSKTVSGSTLRGSESEIDVKATYVPYNVTAGAVIKFNSSDVPELKKDTEAIYSLKVATFEDVLAKLDYRNIDKIIRGEVQYSITPDTTVTAMYKVKGTEKTPELKSHRFIKLEKAFNASNKISISYGIDDVENGRVIIDKGWDSAAGKPAKAHNYLKIAFNTKF